MAYVVVFTEGAPPQRLTLSGPAVVGRALGCEIWLDDPQLSRRHCSIEPGEEGQWLLRDLDSRNGTFLERDQVHTHVLKDGDSIYVGGARIHFHADSKQVAAHRPSDPNEASRGVHAEAGYQSLAELGARPLAHRRLPKPPPVPSIAARPPEVTALSKAPHAVPLAFQRAAAKPIVAPGAVGEDSGISSSWFSAVVSRLRRGGVEKRGGS